MKYFAVETFGDTSRKVTGEVVRAAFSVGCTFKKIECLDRVTVGAFEFQRFRILEDPSKILVELSLSGRAVIFPDGSAKLKGRIGKVPVSTLLTASKEHQIYRGPGDPHWKSQFE